MGRKVKSSGNKDGHAEERILDLEDDFWELPNGTIETNENTNFLL